MMNNVCNNFYDEHDLFTCINKVFVVLLKKYFIQLSLNVHLLISYKIIFFSECFKDLHNFDDL